MTERSIEKPRGRFVVLVGPDGSGKSTVSKLLALEGQTNFSSVWHFHWRPGLLPKLGRTSFHRRRQHQLPTDLQPPHSSKYKGIISLARFVYYWLDFVLGYWLVIFPRKLKGTLIIGERYYLDVIVNPERYGFSLSKWFLRVASKCVVSPDLTILLKDNPSAIFARKSELSVDTISAQLNGYTDEAQNWHRFTTIETSCGPSAVALQIQNNLQHLSRNRITASRRALDRSWIPFPSDRHTKVWVSVEAKLESALNLYQPLSSKGCFVKWLATTFPQPLVMWMNDRTTSTERELELTQIKTIICRIFNNFDLVVNFSIGTPGKHQKTTAQVVSHGRTIAYVKIGSGNAIGDLFQRECAGLSQAAMITGFDTNIPKVIKQYNFDGKQFLFLSAPAEPGAARPIRVDKLDAIFLTATIRHCRGLETFPVIAQRFGYNSLITKLQTIAPTITETVTHALTLVKESLQEDGVVTAFSHGDYAPWNARSLSDDSLYVYDWEYSLIGAPVLNDAFHRVFMPARLVENLSPHKAIEKLLNLRRCSVLGAVFQESGVHPAKDECYLLLYFLEICTREIEGQDCLSTYIRECLREIANRLQQPLRKRRVLVSAYACEPCQGSEPGVGWNWIRQIAKTNETWVITRRNNRVPIEAALVDEPNSNLHFEYVDLPHYLKFWKRKQRGIHIYYYLWQFAALAKALPLNRKVKFDLAHHVTFVNASLWTFLTFLPIPFIWGPIGNHPKSPHQLLPNHRAQIRDTVRFCMQAVARSLDPLFWATVMRASKILVINRMHCEIFPLSWVNKSRIRIEPAIGVDEVGLRNNKNHHTVNILFVGRFVAIKGAHLAIEAFGLLGPDFKTATLTLIGEGPEEIDLRDRVKLHNCQETVAFIPWQTRQSVMSWMQQSDIFLFPSMEGAGMVVLEAMAVGLPVVCLDYGGPGTMVTNSCGIKAPVSDQSTTIKHLSSGLARLISNPALRESMGESARECIRNHFLWSQKSALIDTLYDAVTRQEQ